MALILVVLVLTALVAIGTPFVISMKLQDRGSVQTVAREEAHLAALSARNHAVAHLFATHASRESDAVDDEGVPAHKVDDTAELQAEFAEAFALDGDADGAAYAMRGGASERTLDAEVEDEQGKINLNTAMPNLIGNLLCGSHLTEKIEFDQALTELPLEDTSSFPADDDPDTVDGVVAILNPIFFTVEAVSYRGKTDTHLTGCFRGEYLSGTWEHQEGWPVFDLRGLKVFLHRYYDLGEGEIDTFRTPLAIREIAEWSVIPYFLETVALFGLDVKTMQEFGLTPEMLLRAGLGQFLDKLERDEQPVDEEEYRETRRSLVEVGVPAEAIDMLEQFRGKAGVVHAGKLAKRFDLDAVRANAFKGVFESTIKTEFARVKKHARGYFPAAIRAYQEIYDQPGLETFTAADYERIRHLITTSSTIDALWSAEQMVEGEISTDPILGVPSFRLERYDHFNPGTLVRVRSLKDPGKVEFHLAAGAFPSPGAGQRGGGRGTIIQGGVILKDALKHEYGEREAVVSAMLRHPVNINTAPARVIEAVLTGLSTDRFQQPFDSVTFSEARKLTDRILEERPIAGFAEFREIIHEAAEDELIDGDDVGPILLNAVNPNHPRLTISTTGFCFASGDVFTVEASGVVRSPAGVELASHRFREVIEVAPPDPLVWELDSQDDWTGVIFRRPVASSRQWTTATTLIPGRTQNLMTTGPVPLNQRDFEAPALDQGALLGLTLDSGSIPGITVGVEHFSESIEGLELDQQSYTHDILQVIREPLSVDLWVRPRGAGGGTIFDTLADPTQPLENRIRLRVDPGTRELVFEMWDDARVTQWDRKILPAVEIRHPLAATEWRPDTWVHLTAAWGSTTPGDQVLLLDQRPVGRHLWVTSLAATVAEAEENILVLEDADIAERLPASGCVWVGGEAIEYAAREGTRLRIGAIGKDGAALTGRGRRGTSRQTHLPGTPVRPYGYSLELVPSYPGLPPETPGVPIGGTGGARLEEILMPPQAVFTPFSIIGGAAIPGVGQPTPYFCPFISWSEPLQGNFVPAFTPGTPTVTVFTSTPPDQLGFPQNGYLLVRYLFLPNGGTAWVAREEYVRYSAIVPGGAPNTFQFTGLIRGRHNTPEIDTTESALAGAGSRWVEVLGVSVETDVTDLSSRYPPSGVVQVTPVSGDVEWILYDWIAEDRFFIADPRQPDPAPRYFHHTFRGFDADMESWTPVLAPWPAKLPLVPVLRVLRPGPERGDRVLLAETLDPVNGRREPASIAVRKAAEGADGAYVGLERATVGTYDTLQLPRLRKFPSGELPVRTSGQLAFGRSAEAGGGDLLSATIDEVRVSQVRGPGEWRALLVRANGVPESVTASNGTALIRDFSRAYDPLASVDAGKWLDRIRVFPLARLVGDGTMLQMVWSAPNEFARGRKEYLLHHGGEIFLGEEVAATPAAAVAVLERDLPREIALAPLPPGTPVSNIPRDPRREVVPEVLVTSTSGLPSSHGFLEIITPAGPEVIYYENAAGTKLQNVQRGLFGTIVGGYRKGVAMRLLQGYDLDLLARGLLDREAEQGTWAATPLPLPLFPVARLEGPIDYQVPLSNTDGFSPQTGYLRFDDGDPATVDEIIATVDRDGDALLLARDDRTGRPIFRERFGSPPRQYPADTVVIELLARYHDRYEHEVESPHLQQLGRSVSIAGAHWDRIGWEVTEDRSGAGRAEVVVLARLDGEPDWDTRPENRPGSLYLFHEPDDANRIDRSADQLEFRIHHRFRPGSWGLAPGGIGWNDEWKRAPVLDRLAIEYRKGWRIVHREDLPF